MLANIYDDSPKEHRRLFVAGVAYIVVIALFIWLAIAFYDKKFTASTDVTVMADRAGLQLAKFGDVRLHGALIGHVQKIETNGEKAVITVSLKPAAARVIAGNASVKILPTTLFGQNFIEFETPKAGTAEGRLTNGSIIPASRVSTN